jgi:hypothetical protein
MDKNQHPIDKLFKSELESNESDPSSAVWENLSAKLDRQSSAVYKKRYKNLKAVSFVLLFLFLSITIFEGIQLRTAQNKLATISKSLKESTQSKNFVEDPQRPTEINNRIGQEQELVNLYPSYARDKEIKNLFADHLGKEKYELLSSGGAKRSSLNERNDVVSLNTIGENNRLPEIKKATEIIFFKPLKSIINNDEGKDAVSFKRNFSSKKNNENFKPYWSVFPFASYDLCDYKLEDDLPDNINGSVNNSSKVKDREKYEASFSAGAFLKRQIKQHWGVQTGLIYANSSIVINAQKVYAIRTTSGEVVYKYNLSSGYTFIKPLNGNTPSVGDSVTTTNAQHNLQSVSVPVMALYTKKSGRFSISSGAGLTGNFLTEASLQTEVVDASGREKASFSKLEGLNKFSLGLIVNGALCYKFSDKVSVGFNPTFRYSLTPITKNTIVKTFPYSFMIGAGIAFKM